MYKLVLIEPERETLDRVAKTFPIQHMPVGQEQRDRVYRMLYRDLTEQSGGIDTIYPPVVRFRASDRQSHPPEGEQCIFWLEGSQAGLGGVYVHGHFLANRIRYREKVTFWLSISLLPLPENDAVAYPS